MNRTTAFFFGWFVLAGCSGDDGDAPAAQPLLTAPAEGAGLQLALSFEVPSGSEVLTCRHFVLPPGADLDVARLEHAYGAGTHHLIAYRTSLSPDEVDDALFDCGDIAGPFAYASQLRHEENVYPA